jgi:hypothetical protein
MNSGYAPNHPIPVLLKKQIFGDCLDKNRQYINYTLFFSLCQGVFEKNFVQGVLGGRFAKKHIKCAKYATKFTKYPPFLQSILHPLTKPFS